MPTAFAAFCGVIWMYASTQVLFALPQFAGQPAVMLSRRPRRPGQRPTARVGEADVRGRLHLRRPATAEVICTVQLAVAAPPA